MKLLGGELQAHLDGGATTLCWCWRMTRMDGVRLGFTDHDRSVVFEGTVFEATTGFTGSEIESSVGLSVDNLDVESVLKSESLNEDDLAAGLFDNAEIEIFRVNWQAPDQRVLMRSGNLGEVARGGSGFRAEVRGLAHQLQQPKGRTYQIGCDADLGDGRCTVDLDQSTLKGNGVVSVVLDEQTFRANGLESFESDWFTRGLLTFTSGANVGQACEVKLHSKLDGVVTLELWQRVVQAIAFNDDFTITAGCDKQFSTCKAKFSNHLNFRGFPHIPGNDFAVSYPNSDDTNNDGGSRFS